MRRVLLFFVLGILVTSAAAQNIPDLTRDADAGNIDAQLKLGHAYQYGDGVTRDLKQAVRLYRTAAAAGSGEAAYRLGMMAYNGDVLGDNVSSSLPNAWAWFEVAKVNKHPEGAEALSRLESELSDFQLRRGRELAAIFFSNSNNPKMATVEVEWLKEHGSSTATLVLGELYRTGQGVNKDLKMSRELCKEAAKLHVEGANFCLGKILEEEGNQVEAFKLFEKDARAAMPAAMLEVAQRQKDGNGTTASILQALAWLMKAESLGVEEATAMKIKFAEGITQAQLEQAVKLADSLKMERTVFDPHKKVTKY